MPHPDLAAEQAHVDHAYDRLQAMRAAATEMLRVAFGERGGTFQAVTERDIRVRTSLNRLEQLQLGRESLVFGRIDRRTTGREGGALDEAFHIGRLAVSDEDQEPLVVDWRAPVAEPFYRATGAHPMGLTRRRHFMTEGRKVIDLEDELFGEGEESGAGRLGLGLSGSAVLLAALERSRTGRMRDIVATVQREQDEVIRGPLAGILVVQGGPGTGKTAVALHRAAYLLYTHRFPLETQGVLVVGPNPLFLRYIEQVLPSLGENGVELSTVGRLSGMTATSHDDRKTTKLKGDPRMARLLARSVSDRQRPLPRTVQIPFGRFILRLTRAASSDIVSAARRRAGTHNARRRYVEALLWRELHRQYLDAEARAPRPASDADPGEMLDDELDADNGDDSVVADTELTPDELGRDVRRLPEVVEALDRMWPLLTPQQLLHDLFGAPPLVELAGRKLLTPEEQALLHRRRSPAVEEVAWSDPDLALLDEALALLGPSRRRARSGFPDPVRSYGHIVVDEAQDVSPMELRMLGRRSLSGSMTVVGDVAQATGEWAHASWSEVVGHLPFRRGTRIVELTVNYRTPSEIMDLASRVLQAAAPDMRPPDSVRATGMAPRFIGVSPSSPDDLHQAAAGIAADEAVAISGESPGGTVAVISPPSQLAGLAATLHRSGIGYGTVAAGALDDAVTLLTVEAAKGLEFDAVVVVEPAAIVAEAAQGLRSLYVALTRATRHLAIVHSAPLPEPLRT